jgi:hypothetical protein
MTRTSAGPWSYDAETGEVTTADTTGDWMKHPPPNWRTTVCTTSLLDGLSNGELIAAAPELRDALRDSVAALGGIKSDNVPESARAVLAKLDDAYDATDRTAHMTDCASVQK